MSGFDKNKTYGLFDNPMNKKRISQITEPVIFPSISTNKIAIDETVLENLPEFDWLIFPDVYTVEFFVEALEEKAVDLFVLDEIRVLAFGEAVADRLRFSQLHADVIPSSIKTSVVLQDLKDYIFDDLDKVKFLLLKPLGSEIELAKNLPNVTELAVYSFSLAEETEIPKLKALLKGGAIDEFIFASHYDVLNLAQIFQTENLEELLKGVTLTATDNLTLQSLQEFRLVEK